uniref:DNA topoisomerase I DNA binding eukaryotic-type domain-containing protein n=1 Tax=Parascaris equorum TaxID=6256 RepID=A0A914RX21_PAREQ
PARGSFEEALSASSVARVKQTKPKKEVKEESNGGVDSDDDVPLSARIKEGSAKKRHGSDEEDDDYAPQKKKKKDKKAKEDRKSSSSSRKSKEVKKEPKENNASPTKKKKKEEEDEEVWKWWEEEKKPDGIKWNSLSHKGPVFAPDYIPLPDDVVFKYDGNQVPPCRFECSRAVREAFITVIRNFAWIHEELFVHGQRSAC